MKIKDIALSAAYVGQSVVKAICVGAQEVWSAIKYIVFADPVVEQICATNWGDGVGITEEQAASVTDIGTVFRGNTEITSFDEFWMFDHVETLGVDNTTSKAPFYNCTNLSHIKLPKGLKVINHDSFNGCASITHIEFPEGITAIKDRAFKGVPLTGEISLPNLVDLRSDVFVNSTFTKVNSLGKIKSIPWSFMAGNTSLVYCHIPESVTTIGTSTFNGCTALEDIGSDLSGVVTISEQQNFRNTPSLKIDIRFDNLTRITGSWQFYNSGILTISFGKIVSIPGSCVLNCKELHRVSLPNTITRIGSNDFINCPKLTEVIIYATTPPTLGTDVFTNTPIANGGGFIYVPDQSVQAYREASGWSAYADRIKPLSQYVEPTNE